MKRILAIALGFVMLIIGTASAATLWTPIERIEDEESGVTIGEKNALRVGEDYLDAMGFSYEGLIDQLEYEGFTHEEAVYACDILFERNGLPIKKGSKGEKVKEIQTQLKELGFLAGSIDGDFGGGTEKAVKAFQTNCGLEVTGVVDEKTYEKLFEEKPEEYTFIGKISLAMDMDIETLWESASAAAFGSVTVMTDIVAEEIFESGLDTIKNVFLGKVTIQGKGEILAYYFFRDESVICAIFNPATGEITASETDYAGTPQQAMLSLYNGGAISNYCVVDIELIEAIIKDLMD